MKILKSICLAALLLLTSATTYALEEWEERRIAIKQELIQALELSDLDAITEILDRERDSVGGDILSPVYEKAVNSCNTETLDRLEALLSAKECD